MYYNRNLFIILIDIEGGVLDTNIYYTPYFNLVKKKIYFNYFIAENSQIKIYFKLIKKNT